jgi:hypothetical protein
MADRLTDQELNEIRDALPPEGPWVNIGSSVNVPFRRDTDAPPTGWDSGRYLTVEENEWHDDGDLPREVWEFIARSPRDVRALLAHIEALTAERDTALRFALSRGSVFRINNDDAPWDEQQRYVRLMQAEAAVRPGGDQHLDYLLNRDGGES